jgi:hypothetical protein
MAAVSRLNFESQMGNSVSSKLKNLSQLQNPEGKWQALRTAMTSAQDPNMIPYMYEFMKKIWFPFPESVFFSFIFQGYYSGQLDDGGGRKPRQKYDRTKSRKIRTVKFPHLRIFPQPFRMVRRRKNTKHTSLVCFLRGVTLFGRRIFVRTVVVAGATEEIAEKQKRYFTFLKNVLPSKLLFR